MSKHHEKARTSSCHLVTHAICYWDHYVAGLWQTWRHRWAGRSMRRPESVRCRKLARRSRRSYLSSPLKKCFVAESEGLFGPARTKPQTNPLIRRGFWTPPGRTRPARRQNRLLQRAVRVSDCRRLVLEKEEHSDLELMTKVGAGDMCALGELIRRHQQKVLALAYRTLGRWDLAEDVTQEVFLRVHRSASRFKPKAKVTTWLYRIAVNLCLDTLRRAKRNPVAIPDEDKLSAPTGRDPLEARERVELVQRAVADLPDRQRTVLNLFRYQELSHKEIIEATGWSASAVESLLVRAYANLRKSLSKLK